MPITANKKENKEFSEEIEGLSLLHGLTIMEAILYHCRKTGLEVEVAAKMLTAALKKRALVEATELKLLKPKKEVEK